MAEEILEKIPLAMKWEITAKTLTGAFTALGSILIPIVGKEKWQEINDNVFGGEYGYFASNPLVYFIWVAAEILDDLSIHLPAMSTDPWFGIGGPLASFREIIDLLNHGLILKGISVASLL